MEKRHDVLVETTSAGAEQASGVAHRGHGGVGWTRRAHLVSSVALAAAMLAACSASGSDSSPSAESPPVAEPIDSVDAGPDLVPVTESDTDAASGDIASGDAASGDIANDVAPTTDFDLAAQPSAPAIEPIPETGVPGIESADVFCRAWSEFAGSFQALGLTSAVGDSANAFRLEVIAASSVTSAVEALEANLPAELEAERTALVVDFAGPFFTRALLAEADLEAAGVDPDSLRDLWLRTLAIVGVDDPFIDFDLTSDIDTAALDSAIASFSDEQPSIVEDETLRTDASIPLTETYLANTCPDGGILSGNDGIDN